MDGTGDLLTALRAAVAAFDDDALASLANKGLVRRARKDLETTRPVVLGPEGDRLRVEVGDATAALALPPSRSTCSCPAGGGCRHVLAALIFVRETDAGPAAPAGPSAADEVLGVDDAAIAGWAGKALVARAAKTLGFGPSAEVEEAGALVVRFPTRNVTCRWMPGGGLAGMVCSCHAPGPCEHKVAAVLAVQAARGGRDLSDPGAARGASADAPLTRGEVLGALGDALAALVTGGTARLSRATAERLRALGVSAHGVDLPRLERLVRALADEAELALSRHAQADPARLLAAAARAEALRHALSRPTPALVGEHRSAYEPVGDVELVGLGARAWRTRSGYAGLTVYFWDRSARSWSSWTDARPTATAGGFDPRARYHSGGPWAGVASPSHASRNVLRLNAAWRNRAGRVSGRPSTRAFVTGPSDPAEAPSESRWSVLSSRAADLFGGGFRDRAEGDALVRLVPAGWGPAGYDAVRQEAVRAVTDADGRALPLVVANAPENRDALTALETFAPGPGAAVLGLLTFQAGRLAVEPVAFHDGAKVVSLTLDGPTPTARTPVPAAVPAEDDGEESDDLPDDAPERSSTPLGGLLDRLSALLESIGEGGFASFRGLDDLRAAAARADAVGLSACARSAGRVVALLERQRRGDPLDDGEAARALLGAYHVARLTLAHEAVAVAASALGPG